MWQCVRQNYWITQVQIVCSWGLEIGQKRRLPWLFLWCASWRSSRRCRETWAACPAWKLRTVAEGNAQMSWGCSCTRRWHWWWRRLAAGSEPTERRGQKEAINTRKGTIYLAIHSAVLSQHKPLPHNLVTALPWAKQTTRILHFDAVIITQKINAGLYCANRCDCTHWFVDPEYVSAVCEGLIRPKVGHGLGLDPRALFPLQHAGTCSAIQRVDLTERGMQTTHTDQS